MKPSLTESQALEAIFRLNSRYHFSGFQMAAIGLFVKSLANDQGTVDVWAESKWARKEWVQALECNHQSYVSRIFSELEAKEVLYRVRTVGTQHFHALHPEFLTSLLDICQMDIAKKYRI